MRVDARDKSVADFFSSERMYCSIKYVNIQHNFNMYEIILITHVFHCKVNTHS